MHLMARTYLVFGDIEGKLDVLRVECGRCQRKGRYSVRRLIKKYGRELTDFRSLIDCINSVNTR